MSFDNFPPEKSALKYCNVKRPNDLKPLVMGSHISVSNQIQRMSHNGKMEISQKVHDWSRLEIQAQTE